MARRAWPSLSSRADRWKACCAGSSRQNSPRGKEDVSPVSMELNLRSSFPRLVALLVCLLPATVRCETKPSSHDRHVVVVVWDGMRPDFISERNSPALWKLAREFVTFRNHHSVYPTATNVNGRARDGGLPTATVAREPHLRPRIDPHRALDSGELEVIRKGDEASGGKYLPCQPSGNRSRRGPRPPSPTKSVAFLHDRQVEWTTASRIH